jgi:hypothetical protein
MMRKTNSAMAGLSDGGLVQQLDRPSLQPFLTLTDFASVRADLPPARSSRRARALSHG